MEEIENSAVELVEVVEPEGPKPLFSEDELSNIRAIKLSNGEDIIACIHAFNQQIMVVRRPCKTIRIANEDGTTAVVLLKWHVFSNEETHIIQMSAIVSYSKITQEMKDFYIQSVVKQISQENIEANLVVDPLAGFEWPEWMDKVNVTDKLKIN